MVNTEIRLVIFFAAKDGEALYHQQKQDWEPIVAQIMNSLLQNSDKDQFSSVTQLCLTHCYPTDCSTPGFSVHHQLPEFSQILVYLVDNAIQQFHPLSSPSLSAFSLSQDKRLFK